VPAFKYYAFADGLRALFTRHPGLPETRGDSTAEDQLELWADGFA
jgi:hypothetical protein